MISPIPIIEATFALFILILFIAQFFEKERILSKKRLQLLLIFCFVWLIVDCLCCQDGFINKPTTNFTILYILNLISRLFVPTIPLIFMLCCDAFFREKANIPKWLFTIPCFLEAINFIVFLVSFLTGKIWEYNDGIFNSALKIPVTSIVIYAIFGAYVPATIYLLRKKYGFKTAYLVGLYLIPVVVGIVIIRTTHKDVSAICNGAASVISVIILERVNVRTEKANKNVAENNERILALVDNFESLYDVNLNTLSYDSYVKGQTYSDHIVDKLENSNNFFVDTLNNVKSVVYPDDIQKFDEIMNPDYIIDVLEKQDHFDHVYRLLINGEPKWLRMRIVYKNSKKDHIIVGVFSYEDEMAQKNKDDQLRKQLVEKMINNDALFVVNVETDKRTTLHSITVDRDEYSDKEKFSTLMKRYIQKSVIPYDRKKVAQMTDLTYVLKRVNEEGEFSFRFRESISGAQRFYEIKFAKFSESEVLMSITQKDLNILEEWIYEKIKGDYFAIFVVDTDEGFTRVLKNEPTELDLKEGDVLPHSELMNMIAAGFEEENPPVKAYFEKLADTNFIKEKFANQDKSSYVFKPIHTELTTWATTTEIVLSRHEPSGDPAFVAICFNFLDKEASQNRILQQRLSQDLQMIGGLAGEYEALLYYNIDESSMKVYSMSEKLAGAMKQIVGRKKIITPELLRDYGESSFVHPDDKKYFEPFTVEYLRKILLSTKKFSQRFRRKIGNEYVWFEMDIIKNENIDERANILFVGFSECDKEIRRENALQTCFNVMNKDIPSYEAVIEVLTAMSEYYGSGRTYVCEILKQKGCLSTTYEHLPENSVLASSKHKEVAIETISHWIEALSLNKTVAIDTKDTEMNSPESIEYFKNKGVKKIILAPVLNNGELVGYIGLDNPTLSLEDFDTIRIVASIAYSEILRRKENDEEHVTLEKVTDAFVSVYFADLSRNYMHNWKIVKSHRDEFGTMNKYTDTMYKYIRFCVEESERERCYKETEPSVILEQFKTKSIYSVNMTDISLPKPHNVVLDFIKVSEDGNTFVLCIRDVTKVLAREREQQQKLQEALELADSANKSKTTFLFNMSHDIRTPMNAIQGFTDMAIKYIDNKEKALDCLQKTQQSGAMLLSLINSVLEVSRIESGHATLDCQPSDIYNSFVTIESTLEELAKVKEIELKFEFGQINHQFVLCDIARCVRILVNVISNAIKYTLNGGRVYVYCEEVGEPENGIGKFKYVVEDNGIGMSEEFQKHVFDQFSREKTSTVSGIQGTGLGMSVVKSFVDLMKGTITCESKQGVGTKFTIILPFEIQKEQLYTDPETNRVIDKSKELENEEMKVKIQLSNKKVLLVDDNALNREIAAEILGDEGMKVEPAFDGLMAVNIVKEKGPDYYDFILMDIQMPIMDGYEATKEIRKLFPDSNIPIIALSANAFKEDRIASIEAGMNDHVAKPINVKELIEVLSRYLKK